MSATSVSVLWGAPYRKPRAGPAAGRRRRPAGRREFRRGCRNSVMEWRCQVGRLGEEAGVGPELDFWVSWPLGWRLMTRGQMRGAGKRVERGEPRPGPVATRCRAGGAGPELGQGGPEREGLRGGPSAPPTGRRCRCSKVGAEGCLLPRGVPREAGAGVRVCIHGCDVCISVWPTHVRMSVCPIYMCVCGCIHVVHSVCMCACAVCVYVCAHVYVYGICVCVFVRVHKHAPARVVCVSVHACVCGGEARRGEAAAPAQSLPRAAALPGSRDAGRGPPPTPGSSPASRAVRLFPLSSHGSASWRSGGKGGVE